MLDSIASPHHADDEDGVNDSVTSGGDKVRVS